jgi:hypothetical protein
VQGNIEKYTKRLAPGRGKSTERRYNNSESLKISICHLEGSYEAVIVGYGFRS